MTARYVLDFLGGANLGSFSDWSTYVSETIRFPALMQNSLTVTVWWLLLVGLTVVVPANINPIQLK